MSISQASGTVRFITGEEALLPPRWVNEIFAPSGADAAIRTIRIRNAVALEAAAFERETIAAYGALRRQIAPLHAVRFWNHIPAIHATMERDRDRYMVFNAGRFKAFEDWYGSSEEFSRNIATASGVGDSGDDLVIHCLATRRPGIAIENPRQISSYRYSRRYGPLPPCFARATVVDAPDNRRLLLVGGTASIRGEDSMYIDSLAMQLDETFENLASLVVAALKQDLACHESLARFRWLRIYHPQQCDVPAIVDAVQSAMPTLASAEMIQAELCRPELLVEIEGIAEL